MLPSAADGLVLSSSSHYIIFLRPISLPCPSVAHYVLRELSDLQANHFALLSVEGGMLALMADGLMVLIRKYTRYYYYSAGKTDELIAIQRGIVWENRSLTAAYLLNFTLGESLISLYLFPYPQTVISRRRRRRSRHVQYVPHINRHGYILLPIEMNWINSPHTSRWMKLPTFRLLFYWQAEGAKNFHPYFIHFSKHLNWFPCDFVPSLLYYLFNGAASVMGHRLLYRYSKSDVVHLSIYLSLWINNNK